MIDQKIIESWNKNSAEWVRIVDNDQIESRRFTNTAIENEVSKLSGSKIIDIGCGEGWLTRSMTAMGKKAIGIDAIEHLLLSARTKGPEAYHQMCYEDIIQGKAIPGGPYNVAVFNFCIYQKDGLDKLLRATKNQLNNDGDILIQTLHPFFLFENGLTYKSQMILNSWKGLPGNFTDGHKWYARTFEDWFNIITESGLKISALREIVNSDQKPVSLILKIN